uniref:Uncharacterized protein n=1 Tax=Oryza nivara TaxID=4536 RepID=A0A0E0GCU5_ORYNI
MAGTRGGFELLHMVAPSMRQQPHYLQERHNEITALYLGPMQSAKSLSCQKCFFLLQNTLDN